jgi:small subunit ribosomal protein S1
MSIKFSLLFEKNNFGTLLKKYNYNFTAGDIIAGTIISIEKNSALVDIGANTLSYLPNSEVSIFGSFFTKDIINVKETNEFVLILYQQQQIVISLKKLKSILSWQRLKELAKENVIISGQLEKSTRQGKLVMIHGLKAFIYNYHLPKYYRRKQLIKLQLPLKLIELSETKNKIILSSKLAYFKNQSNFLKVQQSIVGCITDIKSYGLFVNIMGLKGLLHISEISSTRISNLQELFKKGDLISVTILYVNLNKGRISLSSKNKVSE